MPAIRNCTDESALYWPSPSLHAIVQPCAFRCAMLGNNSKNEQNA